MKNSWSELLTLQLQSIWRHRALIKAKRFSGNVSNLAQRSSLRPVSIDFGILESKEMPNAKNNAGSTHREKERWKINGS
jgi:hypothetical protein